MSLKLLRTRIAGQCHLSPLQLLLHLSLGLLLLRRSASASTVVTHLPGFDGPLPFYLETGYVGVEEETGSELFYYFVESERSPRMDPVILWLTGGPRCTVFSALAFEVGPVKFVLAPYSGDLPQLVHNPLSWTKMASIIFLDSPVCTGFSYARDPKGCDVGDYSSSLQVQRFLNKWFTDHPKYLSNPFYVGGDSYAGMVIPFIAQSISEGIEKRQQPLINLKGYLVGNPMTDPNFDRNYRIPAAHGFGIISDQIYEAAMKNCKGDYINPSNQLCVGVLRKIKNLISEVPDAHILYKKCAADALKLFDDASQRKFLLEESIQINAAPSLPDLDCFTYGYYLAYFWMNNNLTRSSLGIKEQSGDHDLQAPMLSTQAWIRSLNFSIIDDWRAWHLDGQAAGFTIKYANNLTFATIKGGGHTAPEYQPEECFAMARRWLDNETL